MPSQQFISELSQTSVTDLSGVLTRYVREACASDPTGAALALSAAIYSALPVDEDADPPRLLKVADFMVEIGDPPPSIVPDFLPAKKLICLSGAAKQGKSLVGLEFLHSVSTGRKLMGQFPLEHSGTVCYFGLEDGGHEIKTRLMQRGITDIDNFYVCWQSFDMATPDGLQTFKTLVDELPEPPSLIIIDTAREAFRVRDWNDASVVSAALNPLRKWCHKNCTVILITHNNKDKFATGVNKVSGSGALVSSCDSFMILENQKVLENGDLRWDWEMAGRGMKTTKYILQMDTNNLHVRILDSGEVQQAIAQNAQAERKEWQKKIAMALHDTADGAASIKTISQRIESNYKFTGDLMRDMVNADEAEKTGQFVKDSEGAGRPSPLYRLTLKGRNNYLFLPTALDSSAKELINDDDVEDI